MTGKHGKGHNFQSRIMALKISNQNCDIQIPPLSSKPICLPVIHMTHKDTLHKNDVLILSQKTCLSAALQGGLLPQSQKEGITYC